MSTTQQSLMAQAAEGALPPATQVALPAQTTPMTLEIGQGKGGFSVQPTLGELVEFQVTGLLVVFVVLGSITALSGLMSQVLKVLAPNQYYCKKPVVDIAKDAAVPAATASGLSQDTLLVLLAAATHEVLGEATRVLSYKAVDSFWALQGRVAHHHSHTL